MDVSYNTPLGLTTILDHRRFSAGFDILYIVAAKVPPPPFSNAESGGRRGPKGVQRLPKHHRLIKAFGWQPRQLECGAVQVRV